MLKQLKRISLTITFNLDLDIKLLKNIVYWAGFSVSSERTLMCQVPHNELLPLYVNGQEILTYLEHLMSSYMLLMMMILSRFVLEVCLGK